MGPGLEPLGAALVGAACPTVRWLLYIVSSVRLVRVPALYCNLCSPEDAFLKECFGNSNQLKLGIEREKRYLSDELVVADVVDA